MAAPKSINALIKYLVQNPELLLSHPGTRLSRNRPFKARRKFLTIEREGKDRLNIAFTRPGAENDPAWATLKQHGNSLVEFFDDRFEILFPPPESKKRMVYYYVPADQPAGTTDVPAEAASSEAGAELRLEAEASAGSGPENVPEMEIAQDHSAVAPRACVTVP